VSEIEFIHLMRAARQQSNFAAPSPAQRLSSIPDRRMFGISID
jgi:hypothetical protein